MCYLKNKFSVLCISLLSQKRTCIECVHEPPFEVQSPRRDTKSLRIESAASVDLYRSAFTECAALLSAMGPSQYIRDAWRGFLSVSVVRSQALVPSPLISTAESPRSLAIKIQTSCERLLSYLGEAQCRSAALTGR